MKQLAIFVALAAVASAHLCTLAPPQRGAMLGCDLQVVGADCCAYATAINPLYFAPCGGVAAGPSLGSFVAGSNITVVFQKNENHWNANPQGSFTVSYAYVAPGSDTPTTTTLAVQQDTNTTSGTMFAANVQLPNVPGPGYIQVMYYTANPAVLSTTFYQCSDVTLIATSSAASSASLSVTVFAVAVAMLALAHSV